MSVGSYVNSTLSLEQLTAEGGLAGLVYGLFAPSETKNAAGKSEPSWFEQDFANLLLIVLGIVLGISALIISQRKTVVNIANTAAKGAALVA